MHILCYLGVSKHVLLARMVSTAAKLANVAMELLAFTLMGPATVLLVGRESTVKVRVNKATTVKSAHSNVSVSMAVTVIISMGRARVQLVGWEVTAVRLVR